MKIVFLAALICFTIRVGYAQTFISLQDAIETALKNNLLLKNEKLNSEYQQKIKWAAIDIPQTNLFGEFGQINSIYNDTKFGISQSVSFPTVYIKQIELQNQMYKTSILNIAANEKELKKQVSQSYYSLINLQEKKNILLQIDSLYKSVLMRTELRFNKGESNILEKITAETQRGQIQIELERLVIEIQALQLQFQLLLNSTTVLTPSLDEPKIILSSFLDSSQISNHPYLRVLDQRKQVGLVNTKLEKSRFLPNINIAYNNMSMKGTGADNQLYNASNRFSSLQFGVGIPLFFGPQNAKIRAAQISELISQNNYQTGLQNFSTQYKIRYNQYQNQWQTVKYYQQSALKNATIITKTAKQQFDLGNINYLEFIMLINNAISIQINYLQEIKNLNLNIIELNYLTSN